MGVGEPSEASLRSIRDEWRELGYFYDRDDAARLWRIVGSSAGLIRFVTVLRDYVADPRNRKNSEHEHYGPYMSLEIMTWPTAGMDGHAIHGPLEDLARLADMVEGAVARLKPGETKMLRAEYAPEAKYELVIELRDDGFDPASADRWFQGKGGGLLAD